MREAVATLQRRKRALTAANQHVTDFLAKKVGRMDFDRDMTRLADANKDLPEIREACSDPYRCGHEVAQRLEEVLRAIEWHAS